MMIALIPTNVLPIPTNVTMLPPVPIPLVYSNVLVWLVLKPLDVNVPNIDECTVGTHTCTGDMIECDDKAPGFNCRYAIGYEPNVILMMASHATVTLDTLVTVLMSASISTNVRLVTIIAMLMHLAPILTAVSPALVTMASPVTVLPVMMSMNAKVKMNVMPTVHAPILMAVMNVPVT